MRHKTVEALSVIGQVRAQLIKLVDELEKLEGSQYIESVIINSHARLGRVEDDIRDAEFGRMYESISD